MQDSCALPSAASGGRSPRRVLSERMAKLRRVVFEDSCRWLHRALHAPGDQRHLQARAWSLALADSARTKHNRGPGAYRAWLVRLLCGSVYAGHAAPAIDVHDPPIEDMAKDPRVTPGIYKRFLAVCRVAEDLPLHPDINSVVARVQAPEKSPPGSPAAAGEDQPPAHAVVAHGPDASMDDQSETESESECECVFVIDGPLTCVDELVQMHRASIERARTCDKTVGECEAEVSRCSAALDAATEAAAQAKNNLLAASAQLSNAIRARTEAIAEQRRMQSALRHAEMEQRAECAICRRRERLQSMRRLTLCCGHLCCLDCLRSTLPAALRIAADSDSPLLCPGCAAHRPSASGVRVDEAVAAAVPPEAHAMVDPLALALAGGAGEAGASEPREEWERVVAERVAEQQVTFGDFVAARAEQAGGQRARLSRCPRCPAFSAHGLSCYATGAARCTNPRCAQLYCSRCGAFPFHFGLPCPGSDAMID
eukprot:m51a1_g7854 hypothetical protein (483) ;mRNA; f:240028-241692